MFSESAFHAARICREITRYSKTHGASEHQLEHIAYLLLVAFILQDESRTSNYLPGHHVDELENLVLDLLRAGNHRHVEKQLEELSLLLSQAMQISRVDIPRGPGILGLAVEHIAGMLVHELRDLGIVDRKHVVDVLFYRLFARLVPSHQRHHELVARLASPLAEFYGGVSESQPGPGEVFVVSRTPDYLSSNNRPLHLGLPREISDSFRFIRNLRLAAHRITFEVDRKSDNRELNLIDTTFDFNKSSYGNEPIIFDLDTSFERLVTLRRQSNSPMLMVVGGQDRRSLKSFVHARKELVENQGLRAVIDFNSPTAKREATLSLWYFGPPFPLVQDQIVHIDARHLCSNPKTDEALSCASLLGELLRCWAEGMSLSKSRIEGTGAPRRVIAFIEEAMSKSDIVIPGFIRFVGRDDMWDLDYSLRAGDYVGKNEDRSWQAEVEISPILSCLRAEEQSSAVYLIGNNGAGKSLAMRDLAMALALEGHRSFGVSFGTTDRFDRSPRSEPLKSQFTYAGARTLRSGPNVRRSLGELGDMVKEIYRSPERLACLEAALETLGFRPRQFLVPVEMNSTSDHWERLIADVYPLSALSNTQEEQGDLNRWQALPNGAYKLAFVRRDSPEILVFDSLSSGEQQVLTMVIKIVANVQRSTTVLLDEPEISLHVAWQRQLPHVLRDFSRRLGCSFVVATHSPIVLASANDLNDRCFVMQDRRLQELKPDQRRSVEASLFEGFNTYTPYTHHVQERCAEIVSRIVGEADEEGFAALNETALLEELKSLRDKLDAAKWHGADQDITLVNKAIIAVQDILDL